MTVNGRVGLRVLAMCLVLLAHPGVVRAQMARDNTPERDGQHDFDFLHGEWKATLKKLVGPLTGSTKWVEFEGTQSTRSMWGGGANVDEFVVDNDKQNVHIRGLTLRLYNPKTHEWSIYWANAAGGTLGMPPVVGKFVNGRGEFYDQEEFNGRTILVRYVWSNITPTSAHFEQSFSTDVGKTWEPNWISDVTRIKK